MSSPPQEIRQPVETASAKLSEAMAACRSAAAELAAVIRTSSEAGYGTGWILEAARLNSKDLDRILQGEDLF
ncbi:hypothetical protein NicSoilE8_43050 (plasmid) [Arthrobacter sp. NicSoilE8]|nr:hypothetical protein NicSoilE8_43050 [Arthrobacter sp. NicSoilE8]